MKNIQITTYHKRGGKAREKRCGLSLDLKIETEGASLIEGGSLFQRRGAATALSPSPVLI